MISVHFGDIRKIIIESISQAKYDLYVAVAWITDAEIMELLRKKIKEGLSVQVVLVKDTINMNNGLDYTKFCQEGGQLFWDDHHHKFCVIDRKVVITGSYNWTYAANNRGRRENILIINDDDNLIEAYSKEFRILIKLATKHEIPEKIKIIEIEKIIQIPPEKTPTRKKSKKPEVESLKQQEKFIASFNGTNIICGKCKCPVNSNNTCGNCNTKYKYNAKTNKYESYFYFSDQPPPF